MKLLTISSIVFALNLSVTCLGQNTDSIFFNSLKSNEISTDSLITTGQLLKRGLYPISYVRGQTLIALGYLKNNELDSVSNMLFSALYKVEQIDGDSFEAGVIHNLLGMVFSRFNNHARATQEFLISADIFQKHKNIEYLSIALSNAGASYSAQSNYPKALQYYLEAEQEGISAAQRSSIFTNLSEVYSRMVKPRAAIKYALAALTINQKALDSMRIIQTYNALGSIYYELYRSDSALLWYNKTLKFAAGRGEFIHETAEALQNILRIYADEGKANEAKHIIKQLKSINTTYQSDVYFNRLADYYRGIGKYDSSIYFARKALNRANFSHNKQGKVEAYYSIQLAFKAKKQFDSAYYYIDLENIYDDSIYSKENAELFDNQRIAMETLGKERELIVLRQDAALRQAEQRFTQILLLSSLAAGALLLACVVLFYQNRQNKHQLKTLALEEELRSRSNQLRQQALKMIYINNGLNEVEQSLERLSNETNSSAVKQALKTIHVRRSLEKEWDNFNHYFSHLHVGFFEKLERDYPTLTAAERRLAGLVRMNLTNREISGLINIEENSVKMAKYRLKKKLNLGEEDTLFAFLQGIAPNNITVNETELKEEV